MNAKEFGQLAAAIKTYFPRDNVLPTENAMELWYDALKDLPYTVAELSLKRYVCTNKFPPTIADIRENAVAFDKQREQELNEMEAWQLVLKAMKNSIYHSEEEFAKLPPLVQKAVVSPGQLREWAMSEDIDGTWMNVTQSNFIRTYRMELSRKKEISKLSPDLQRLVGRTTEQVFVKQNETKSISASEEMRLLEQNAVPMPERFKDIYVGWACKSI